MTVKFVICIERYSVQIFLEIQLSKGQINLSGEQFDFSRRQINLSQGQINLFGDQTNRLLNQNNLFGDLDS